jgi:hypothetical protein
MSNARSSSICGIGDQNQRDFRSKTKPMRHPSYMRLRGSPKLPELTTLGSPILNVKGGDLDVKDHSEISDSSRGRPFAPLKATPHTFSRTGVLPSNSRVPFEIAILDFRKFFRVFGKLSLYFVNQSGESGPRSWVANHSFPGGLRIKLWQQIGQRSCQLLLLQRREFSDRFFNFFHRAHKLTVNRGMFLGKTPFGPIDLTTISLSKAMIRVRFCKKRKSRQANCERFINFNFRPVPVKTEHLRSLQNLNTNQLVRDPVIEENIRICFYGSYSATFLYQINKLKINPLHFDNISSALPRRPFSLN